MNHNLPWTTRFVYGTGGDVVDWQSRLPVASWAPSTSTVGGTRTSAGHVPAGYVVRRDHNLVVILRLYETELEAFHGLIAWGQIGESFLWYPSASENESFLVYLEAPKAGETWQPRRLREYPKVFEIEIMLRPVVPVAWDLDFFPCVDA